MKPTILPTILLLTFCLAPNSEANPGSRPSHRECYDDAVRPGESSLGRALRRARDGLRCNSEALSCLRNKSPRLKEMPDRLLAQAKAVDELNRLEILVMTKQNLPRHEGSCKGNDAYQEAWQKKVTLLETYIGSHDVEGVPDHGLVNEEQLFAADRQVINGLNGNATNRSERSGKCVNAIQGIANIKRDFEYANTEFAKLLSKFGAHLDVARINAETVRCNIEPNGSIGGGTKEYWSQDRMKNAKPAELPQVTELPNGEVSDGEEGKTGSETAPVQ